MKIDEIGERSLIKKISGIVDADCGQGYVGIGDDAALTKPAEGKWLVTSKDLLVEDVHFLRDAASPRDLGYKSLAVNLSDIAAMGGLPRHAYVALALPRGFSVAFILEFYRGMQSLAERHGVAISGGDIVGSPGPVMISVTVQGEVDRERALLRSGAGPGDLLCVTGELGASAAGLLLLQNEINCPEEIRKAALEAHLRPVPRIGEAAFLASGGQVTAAMDISDGLLKDLGEICEASGCGALLFAEKIPVHPAAEAIARLRDVDPLALAVNGGEDYEILCAVKPAAFDKLAAAYRERFGTDLHPIGEVTTGSEMLMVTKDGKRETLSFKGFQHF
ncbi:MAG: thiamine-phosphate kinase [Bacillota bacterium]|nr:thiamine-phosphate kinase [Bacillota bacterium]MDW7683644.1 thiamine-phosphate kinase [Bacillota bacterium]